MSDPKNVHTKRSSGEDSHLENEEPETEEPKPRPIPPRNPPQNFHSGSQFGGGRNFRSQTDGNARRIHRNAQRGR